MGRSTMRAGRTQYFRGAAVVFSVVGAVFHAARVVADDPWSASGILVSVPGAVVAILVLGSFYEWLVHRFVYHHALPLAPFWQINEIHERGHHWHRFPPDRYVERGEVERIPVYPAAPYELCRSRPRRWVAWAAQYALYLSVGIPLAFVPSWFLTRNPLFAASAVVSGLVVCYFFIRVHDVIHYPGERLIERTRWFRFLDRHHYIHHVDTRVNVNFLLPLCDLLFGTLRTELTEKELRLWPTFEQAKQPRPAETDRAEALAPAHALGG
jgi:hypothetical protein